MMIDLLLRWIFHRSAELKTLRRLFSNSFAKASWVCVAKPGKKMLPNLLNRICVCVFMINVLIVLNNARWAMPFANRASVLII